MPFWTPKEKKKQENLTAGAAPPQQLPADSFQQSSSLDKFISHFDAEHSANAPAITGEDLLSPYGAVSGRQVSIPPKFIPPPQAPTGTPQLPGVESVPTSAVQNTVGGESISNLSVDRNLASKLVEMGFIDLISVYEGLMQTNQKAARQLEELIRKSNAKAPKNDVNPFDEVMGTQGSVGSPRPPKTLDAADFGEDQEGQADVGGVLSDQVFDKLVNKIFQRSVRGGSLPPIGVGSKPKVIYMGQVQAINGVSPSITTYQDFLSEVDNLQKDPNNRGSVEEQVIANRSDKYGIIKKIRERRIAAFTRYSMDTLSQRAREGYNPILIEIIKDKYHCVEIRFDARHFLEEDSIPDPEREAQARLLWIVKEEGKRKSKKKKEEPSFSTFKPKDSLGRSPIAVVTSLDIQTPSGEIISYGFPNLEYPKSEKTALVVSYKETKNSNLILVESFDLLYSLLKPLTVDQVLSYLDTE